MLTPRMALCALVLVPGAIPAHAQCQFEFGPDQLAPIDGQVNAATVWDPDGAGPRPVSLVVGGAEISHAGSHPTSAVAMHEAEEWHSPGGGLWGKGGGSQNSVQALTVFNGQLIAGGSFDETVGGVFLNNIARFDGTQWSPMGQGLNGIVTALVVFNGELYAAGSFWVSNLFDPERIARWDGTEWHAVGGGVSGAPLTMAVFNGSLYVGGDIAWAGTVPVSNLAVWNGSAWSSPGLGVNGQVHALAVHDNGVSLPTLVVGGSFTMAGGIPAPNIARLSSLGQWSTFGAGLHSPVYGLLVRNSGLAGFSVVAVVSSRFTGDPAVVQQFSGGAWGPIGSWTASQPWCVVHYNFQYTVGTSAGVSVYNGAQWGPLGPGLSGTVHALQPFGSDLIFGGDFEHADGQRVNNIARWNGTEWTAMDNGVNGEVRALIVFQDTLWASGAFTIAGSVATNNIAKWNGAAWVGAGLPAVAPGPLSALAVFNGQLIVGGRLGGGRHVHRLIGNSWVDMSNGLDPASLGTVRTFAVWNGDLYAGATLPIIGPGLRSAVARWHPVLDTWLEVEADPTAAPLHGVAVLKPFGGTLYAAGFNLGSSGSLSFPLASVGPSSFEALQDVAQGAFQSSAGTTLTVYEGQLHLTGVFDQVGGQPAANFARLQTAGWAPIVTLPAVFSANSSAPGNAAAVFQGELVYGLIQNPVPVRRWVRWDCPLACYPDCNADGLLTVADFGCFQTRFVAADPYADCNGDGARTVADFGCFQTKFVAGCP